MAYNRPWSRGEIAELRSLAGRLSTKDIADKLGRTYPAVVAEAAKFGISLRTRTSAIAGNNLPAPRDHTSI